MNLWITTPVMVVRILNTKLNYMTNENKDKIIDRVIDFLHNKPLKSDMRIAAALIEELKLLKNCSIPDVVGRSEQLSPNKKPKIVGDFDNNHNDSFRNID